MKLQSNILKGAHVYTLEFPQICLSLMIITNKENYSVKTSKVNWSETWDLPQSPGDYLKSRNILRSFIILANLVEIIMLSYEIIKRQNLYSVYACKVCEWSQGIFHHYNHTISNEIIIIMSLRHGLSCRKTNLFNYRKDLALKTWCHFCDLKFNFRHFWRTFYED
jgi:hypothetical protein